MYFWSVVVLKLTMSIMAFTYVLGTASMLQKFRPDNPYGWPEAAVDGIVFVAFVLAIWASF